MEFFIWIIFIVAAFIAANFSNKKEREKKQTMSTVELEKEYEKIVNDINGRVAAVEVYCKGVSGSVAASGHNDKIAKLRSKGLMIADELKSRGISVDTSPLYAVAKKAPGNDKASVVGRAVAGGIIAGPTGAIVGAISAAEKNKQK